MTVFDFRESKGGHFFHEQGRWQPPSAVMPALRFALAQGGAAVDPWETTGTDTWAVLGGARLDWRVDAREVLTPDSANDRSVVIDGYRALVRPDTGHPMSVVSKSYRHAENGAVAEAAVAVARSHDPSATLVAAVGFGKERERTLFVVRVTAESDAALMLLAYNTHGGEGAIRFQLVEVERESGAVLTPDVFPAVTTLAHIGDVERNLRLLVHRDMVQHYLRETSEAWERLADSLWTPRHTSALISELWPQEDKPLPRTPDDTTLTHPRSHLTEKMARCTDAATAYRAICRYLDIDSEAREKGDFTKDRDERLALGAGLRHKQRAWTWIMKNI